MGNSERLYCRPLLSNQSAPFLYAAPSLTVIGPRTSILALHYWLISLESRHFFVKRGTTYSVHFGSSSRRMWQRRGDTSPLETGSLHEFPFQYWVA
jgi:hypothetical protein